MYAIDHIKLAEGVKRVAQLAHVPLVIPLGRDEAGVWHYRVISVRNDWTVSDQAASFGQGEFEFAGCTCEAGQHDGQCYHVAAAYLAHKTFLVVEDWLWPQLK